MVWLSFHKNLESPVDHALDVEGHRFRVAHVCEAWVFHNLGVDAITMGPRFIHDPRKDHDLAPLESSQSWERHPHLHVEVIAGTLLVVQGTVCSPDFSRLLSHSAVGR